METKNKEVEENSEAVISCVVTGLTQELDSVSWTNSTGSALSGDDYVIDDGSYDSGSQTTTLTVIARVTSDSTFSCVVTSSEWDYTDTTTSVTLNVYGKIYFGFATLLAHF